MSDQLKAAIYTAGVILAIVLVLLFLFLTPAAILAGGMVVFGVVFTSWMIYDVILSDLELRREIEERRNNPKE